MVWKLYTIKGNRSTAFISETAMYKLAFRSNKSEAGAFTDWVVGEALYLVSEDG
jgi:prophage antirepressor-like protein